MWIACQTYEKIETIIYDIIDGVPPEYRIVPFFARLMKSNSNFIDEISGSIPQNFSDKQRDALKKIISEIKKDKNTVINSLTKDKKA